MSRNRKGSRTGRCESAICAFARYSAGEARGVASPGPRQKSLAAAANPEDMSARRGGAARDGGSRFAKRIAAVGRVGARPLFTETCSAPARTLTAMRALVLPRTGPHASDRPTSAAGQISAERAGATCPAAKGCYGQTVLRPKAARVVRSGGSRVPAVGRQQNVLRARRRTAGRVPARPPRAGAHLCHVEARRQFRRAILDQPTRIAVPSPKIGKNGQIGKNGRSNRCKEERS
jgi:hypothetical protein